MQSVLTDDSKMEELLQWENEGDLMDWLDSLWRGRANTGYSKQAVIFFKKNEKSSKHTQK